MQRKRIKEIFNDFNDDNKLIEAEVDNINL